MNSSTNKCFHVKDRRYCKICNGIRICIHKKRIDRCKICGGSGICIHEKQKSSCKFCKKSCNNKIKYKLIINNKNELDASIGLLILYYSNLIKIN